MPYRPATLFRRLRLHKGVWTLLAWAVLIKVASASICLLDGPRTAIAPVAGTGVAQMVAMTMAQADVDPDEACLLGESGDCHCACAHASTLPALAFSVAAIPVLPVVTVHPAMPLHGGVRATDLRPPIA